MYFLKSVHVQDLNKKKCSPNLDIKIADENTRPCISLLSASDISFLRVLFNFEE